MFSYVNNINTREGGTHLIGFKSALTRTLNEFLKKSKYARKIDDSLTGDDVREGLGRMAAKIEGVAGGNVFENFDAAMTAHFVGGCAIGADPEPGLIDAYHRVFGHPGLHVVDGSAITANPGVNP